jgi:hypothetical protein
MAQKTGLVIIYFLLRHAARTWTKYRALAVAEIEASSIPAANKAAVIALLDGAALVMDYLRQITGY